MSRRSARRRGSRSLRPPRWRTARRVSSGVGVRAEIARRRASAASPRQSRRDPARRAQSRNRPIKPPRSRARRRSAIRAVLRRLRSRSSGVRPRDLRAGPRRDRLAAIAPAALRRIASRRPPFLPSNTSRIASAFSAGAPAAQLVDAAARDAQLGLGIELGVRPPRRPRPPRRDSVRPERARRCRRRRARRTHGEHRAGQAPPRSFARARESRRRRPALGRLPDSSAARAR